jgi:ABC-type amino acid transport substrate-binding protein
MNRRLTVLGILVLVGIGGNIDLLACGDKFLVVTRGTRFQRPSARRPASILVFANPASGLPKTLATLPIDITLRKAGYRPTLVSTATELNQALRAGQWDLVLADAADAAGVSGDLQKDTRVVLLVVVFDASTARLKQLKQQYPRILKSPTRSQTVLDAVDEALAARPKSTRSAT